MTPSLLSTIDDTNDHSEVIGSKVLPATNIIEVADPELTTKEIIHYESTYSIVGMPPLPVVMVRGSGAFLWDKEGKQYIDFNAGFSSVNQGHCHPRIVATAMKQIQTLTIASRVVYNEPYVMLCKKLCEVSRVSRRRLHRADTKIAHWF